jgi:hypothetical protein
MPLPYPSTSAVVDGAAANLGLRVTQGDDFTERFRLVSRHYDELHDTIVRRDISIDTIVFEAEVFQANGSLAAVFDVQDAGNNEVLLTLKSVDTIALTPGTYSWWLRGSDTSAGVQFTYLQGALEIRPRPT